MRTPTLAGLVLALAVFVTAAPARAVQVAFTPSSGLAGQTVDVPITVSNVTGLGIRSAQFNFTYNNLVATPTDVIEAGALTGTAGWNDAAFSIDVVSGSTHRISVATAGANAITGTGALLFIRFVINPAQLAATSTSLTWGAFDFNEGSPNDTTANGTLTVNATPIITVTPNSGTLVRGSTLAFSVFGSVSNPVSWFTTNPAVATMSAGGVLTGVSPGTVRVYAVDNAGRRDTTDSDVVIRGMSLSVGAASVFVGNTVSVPINVSSLAGLGIRAGQFTVTYPSSRGVITGVTTPPGTLLSGYGPVGFANALGECTVDFVGTSDLDGSGVLCYLTFAANTTQGGVFLNFTQGLFNETLPAITTGGSVNVTGLPTLGISPDQPTLLVGQTQQFTVSGSVTPPATWTVLDPTIGSITSGGLFTALKGGVTQVRIVDAVGANDVNTSVTVFDFKATLGTVTGPPGATVLVPLESDRLLGAMGIFSLEYAVSFTPTHITNVSANPGGLVGAWSPNVIFDLPAPGVAEVTAAGPEAFTNLGGTIHGLLFTISPAAPPGTNIPITLTSLLCNEGAPIAQRVNGLIQVRNTVDAPALAPGTFELAPCQPNPLRVASRVAFVLPSADDRTRLAVYGADGRAVRVLHEGALPAGTHTRLWDGADHGGARVAPGLYFMRLEWGGRTMTRKVAVLP